MNIKMMLLNESRLIPFFFSSIFLYYCGRWKKLFQKAYTMNYIELLIILICMIPFSKCPLVTSLSVRLFVRYQLSGVYFIYPFFNMTYTLPKEVKV